MGGSRVSVSINTGPLRLFFPEALVRVCFLYRVPSGGGGHGEEGLVNAPWWNFPLQLVGLQRLSHSSNV